MRETTLCYIERDGKYLMLYRSKRKMTQKRGKMDWYRRKA